MYALIKNVDLRLHCERVNCDNHKIYYSNAIKLHLLEQLAM